MFTGAALLRRLRIILLAAAVTAGVCLAPADARKEKVRLAVGSQPGNLVYLHIDLARALGYFEQEGLDVSFRYFDAGTAAAEALNAREFDFSANSIDHAIKLSRTGRRVPPFLR